MNQAERISRRDAILRGIANTHYSVLGPEVQESQYAHISYPGELYDMYLANEQDPIQKAFEAVKIGVLTDKGLLFQLILNDELRIRLDRINPAQNHHRRKPMALKLGRNATTFIRRNSPRLRVISPEQDIEADVNDWYNQATTLQRLFDGENSDQLTFRIGEELFPFTTDGIEGAWHSAQLPATQITHDGTGIFDLAPELGVK